MLRAVVDILTTPSALMPGPKGRNVVLDKAYGARASPRTASPSPRKIELEDKFENMKRPDGVLEVASKTSDRAGDGTTTATVLTASTTERGLGSSPR